MTADLYVPQKPLPMPAYEALMVTPIESNRRPGEIIAFIGKQICFFERGTDIPSVGKPVEVMITRALYHNRKGGAGRDWSRVLALLLKIITPDWTLIAHNGFECSGSMCSTTAHMVPDGPWLTPGRTQIYEASNVNAGYTWKQPYVPRRPGKAWVSTADLKAGKFPLRIEGLARVEDGMYARAIAGAARQVAAPVT